MPLWEGRGSKSTTRESQFAKEIRPLKKRWGLRQACRWPRQDDSENELVQPGFVFPLAWDENLLSLRERVVSALCCVLMERSAVFLAFPTVQAHCRSPTGRSSTVSNAPRPYKWLGRRMQRATMGVIYTSGEIAIDRDAACSLLRAQGAGASCLEHARAFVWLERLSQLFLTRVVGEGLVLNCCNCAVGRAHKDRVEWVRRQLDPPATFSLPDSVSKRAVVDKRSSLREESVKRYMHDLSQEFAHPKINVLHLPQHFSQLEAINTDDDNAKQRKRKIEDKSNCSQPLACAQVLHSVFKQAEERSALRSAQTNHRCPRSNKRHFFIAQSRGWPRNIHFLWQKSLDMP